MNGVNDNNKPEALAEMTAVLTAMVADMREQCVHAGNELPDDQYVDVQLKAGDIRRAVAAINAVGGSDVAA